MKGRENLKHGKDEVGGKSQGTYLERGPRHRTTRSSGSLQVWVELVVRI